jgi:hypothetical protein
MSESKRQDIASFNISFNLPPEVIDAYFNGLAKVESARHGPPMQLPPKSSGFDWTSLIPMVLPLVIPFLSNNSESCPLGFRKYEARRPVSVDSGSRSTSSEQESLEKIRDRLEKQVGPLSKDEESHLIKEVRERVEKEVGPLSKDEESILTAIMTNNHDQIAASSNADQSDASSKKDESAAETSEPKEETKEQKPATATRSSPGENGAVGGFADMMKMFMPMVKQMSSALDIDPSMMEGLSSVIEAGAKSVDEKIDDDKPETLESSGEDRSVPFDE